MTDDVGELIERLALWRTGDGGYDELSLREQAIVALQERRPEAVPALIERLDALLADHAAHLARVGTVTAAWDAWYEEGDALVDEHGLGAVFELEQFRTHPSDSLPQREPRDEHYQDPYDLKQGIVEALRRIGDDRAAPVLGRALGDRACVHYAATALRGIHLDGAVPALLDAAARTEPDDMAFPALLSALEHYGVTMAEVRARFEAESGPQARVSLMHVMKQLPGDGAGRPADEEVRDELVFLAMDRSPTDRYRALRALAELGASAQDDVRDDVQDSAQEDAVEDAPDADFGGGMDAPPPAGVVRAAIVLAAHGRPPGHDGELRRRLRHMAAEAPSATRAVTAVLTREPRSSDEELELALRLAPRLNCGEAEHMALLRALRGLVSYAPAREGAVRALRRDSGLFVLMLHKDPAIRAEARAVFDDVAEPADRQRFAEYEALRLGAWGRLVRKFKRR